jgi:hypothetical protein
MKRPEAKCYVCTHVFERERFVKLVYRDGQDLVLLCGDLHEIDSDCARTVGLAHILEDDPTIADAVTVQSGWQAERSRFASPWNKSLIPPQ